MPRFLIVAALAGAALCSGHAAAETLATGGMSGFENPAAPKRGMTMQRVEASWGQPVARRAAVGDPPITRWEYGDFIVYFEYDRVIHAVSKRGT